MKKQLTIASYIPVFPGFYNTLYEFNEEAIDQEIDYYSQQNKEVSEDDFFIDYDGYCNKVVKHFCIELEKYLKKELGIVLSIKNPVLNSPRFYNYQNDSIDCDYEISDYEYNVIVNSLLHENKEAFEKYLNDNYSGFASYYSTDIYDWINDLSLKREITHLFGSVLNFLLCNHDSEVRMSLFYKTMEFVDEREFIHLKNEENE